MSLIAAADAADAGASARSAITIAWIGAGGACFAGLIAVIGGVVQALLKKGGDGASSLSQLQTSLEWEHRQRVELEKKVSDLQAQLAVQVQMNDALLRRYDK